MEEYNRNKLQITRTRRRLEELEKRNTAFEETPEFLRARIRELEADVDEFITCITTQEECRWLHIIDRLPPRRDYPEAIDDAGQLDYLIRYFLSYIKKDLAKYGQLLLHALYNPLNISWLARELNVACPPGYAEAEMKARNATLDPCSFRGALVPRYASRMRRGDCMNFHSSQQVCSE